MHGKQHEDTGALPRGKKKGSRGQDAPLLLALPNQSFANFACLFTDAQGTQMFSGEEKGTLFLKLCKGHKVIELDTEQAALVRAYASGKTQLAATGEAGTGKTVICMAIACHGLAAGWHKRVVFTRPNVKVEEAGGIGALPGNLFAKLYYYFQPMYEALATILPPQTMFNLLETQNNHGALDLDAIKRLHQPGLAEFLEIDNVRGLDKDDTLIVVDEAQNMTVKQMKALASRGCNQLFMGDLDQIDRTRPEHQADGAQNGLVLWFIYMNLEAQKSREEQRKSCSKHVKFVKVHRSAQVERFNSLIKQAEAQLEKKNQ